MKIWENTCLDNLEGELWKDIKGYEGKYQVSSLGRVKNLKRIVPTWNAYKTIPERILSQSLRNGYLRCKLDNVHRLVAKTFTDTIDHSLQVNHINGDKLDNRADNLEWVTSSENIKHAWQTGLMNDETRRKMSTKAKMRTGTKNSCWRGYIDILTLDSKFITQVDTLKDAQVWVIENTKYQKADKGNISLVCNEKLSKIYGLKFRYNKEEYTDGK